MGEEQRYSLEHAPKPQFNRNAVPVPTRQQTNFSSTRLTLGTRRYGEMRVNDLKAIANLARAGHDPLATKRGLEPPRTVRAIGGKREAAAVSPIVQSIKPDVVGVTPCVYTASRARTAVSLPCPSSPPTARPLPIGSVAPITPAPAPSPTAAAALQPATTGVVPWWMYAQGKLPGVGTWMLNVANGNLVVTATDVNIPGRGLNLAFARTYNSQSEHDSVGSDGSLPSAFGDGWTNTYDAHLSYNSVSNVMSVYDDTGARYDYTSNGSGGWTPPAGQFATLAYDGGCGYYWTLKSGIEYHFYSPSAASCTGMTLTAGYAGRLSAIYGRNRTNYIQLSYSWYGGSSSDPYNLTAINVAHSDGQSLNITFQLCGNYVPEIQTLTRPDGQKITYSCQGTTLGQVQLPGNSSYATLSQGYTYANGHQLAGVASPRMIATENSSVQDGDSVLFTYSAGKLATVQDDGLVNFIPSDGTNTYLQPAAVSGYRIWRTVQISGYSGTTTITDSDGHSSAVTYDSLGRETAAQQWTSSSSALATTFAWDANNDQVSIVDPAGNETDYAYDANGNLIASAAPSVTTSMGTLRPTATYSYDRYNNVVAACDANYNANNGTSWTATPAPSDTLCPTGTGATNAWQYVYNYSDANEPYGLLSSAYNPLGYEMTYAYTSSAQSDNYGLPSSITGSSFTQNDGTTASPQLTLSYDAYGNVASYSKGFGSWTSSYNEMNRPVATTDPDGVTTRICYNNDESVRAMQSARQYALDGSECGPNSLAYTYDADGDLISRTNHFGGVGGTTTYWYDGDDRIVEVMQPADSTIDGDQPGRTRYMYDLSEDGTSLQVGASIDFAAHGNMYKTQRCNWASVGASACTWTDISGTAFDDANRVVEQFRYQPFGSVEGWTTAWDQNGYVGLPTTSTDPMNVQTTVAYTADKQQATIAFSDGSAPTRTYDYDPDGHMVSVSSGTTTVTSLNGGIVMYETSMSDLIGYDANGDVTGTEEESYSGSGRPVCCSESGSYPAVEYSYYPNGWRDSMREIGPTYGASTPDIVTRDLPCSSQACKQAAEGVVMDYSYRSDGLRQTLSMSTQTQPFAWKYTNAGRMLTQSDPYTGTEFAQTSTLPAGTFGPKTFTYDAYGEIASETFPSGTAYSGMTYDAEGENTGYSISMAGFTASGAYAKTATLGYNIRGELTKESFTSSLGTETPVSETYEYDAPVGLGSIDPITGAIEPAGCSFDVDGRLTGCLPPDNTSATLAYDAENHLLYANPSGGSSDGALAWGNLGYPYAYYFGAESGVSTSSGSIIHWDGDQMLYANLGGSSSSALTQWNVEDLAQENCGTATASSACQTLTVIDRDPSGLQVDAHNASGSLGTTVAPNYYRMLNSFGSTEAVVNGQYPAVGGGSVQTGVFTELRPDGYQFGAYTLQGNRAMNSATGQWLTPDWYPGTLDDPSSERAYTWVGNNPVTQVDPSGFVTDYLCDDQSTPDPFTGMCADGSCGVQWECTLNEMSIMYGWGWSNAGPSGPAGGPNWFANWLHWAQHAPNGTIGLIVSLANAINSSDLTTTACGGYSYYSACSSFNPDGSFAGANASLSIGPSLLDPSASYTLDYNFNDWANSGNLGVSYSLSAYAGLGGSVTFTALGNPLSPYALVPTQISGGYGLPSASIGIQLNYHP